MQQIDIDFLIAGSGAGGMVAALKAKALGLHVVLIEKAPFYGGSTAMSGGGIWVPNNYVLKKHGITNTDDEVVAYLKAITKGEVDAGRLKAYATKGPEMFDFLHESSKELQFIWSPGYSDYHPELPGGRKEGRSVEAVPFDLNKLGGHKHRLQPADINIPMGMWLTAKNFHDIAMAMRTRAGLKAVLGIGLHTIANHIRGGKMVALGQSLIGRLRYALLEKNIPLWLHTSVDELLMEGGKVTGAIITRNGEKIKVLATKGVLLATGGFDHNKAMRNTYLPAIAQQDYSAGSIQNMGDGIRMGTQANAALALMDDAWWMPSVQLPDGKMFTLVSERAIPRSIIVGNDGKRFANEAAPYVNFVHAQIASGNRYAWQILDQAAVNRYMYAGKPPLVPFSAEWYKKGIVFKANTIADLADKINVDKKNFIATITTFNQYANNGVDEQYHRGQSAYDKYYGDPTLPNPVLDVLNKPPYYAIKIVMGDLGTKGGIVTNEHAQAIDNSGSIIPGLYTTGNTAASVMGRHYAGAGATIGPAMVFGYIAAQHAAGSN